MQTYTTAEETAVKWNITPRHVQHLCRSGKIQGAVKRAGAWFVPENAPPPMRNTKSNATGFMFVGTKNKIFNSSIQLFVEKGFSNVSIKDIANAVGVRQSTIYNHFKSKQDILDTIYDFYHHHYLLDRPAIEDLTPVLFNGSFLDIVTSISYEFNNEYKQRMSDITKIVFQRISIDERAREIFKELMREGEEYATEVFEKALETGRFPVFDTHLLSMLINSIRTASLHDWIIDSSEEGLAKIAEKVMGLYKLAADFVTKK